MPPEASVLGVPGTKSFAVGNESSEPTEGVRSLAAIVARGAVTLRERSSATRLRSTSWLDFRWAYALNILNIHVYSLI